MIIKPEYEITLDKECDCLKITRAGLEKLTDYYLKKLESVGLNQKHLYKSAYINGMWHMCMSALRLFKDLDESFDEPTMTQDNASTS